MKVVEIVIRVEVDRVKVDVEGDSANVADVEIFDSDTELA